MRIRATISNKNRKVYGFQPPNSERAVLQWCEAISLLLAWPRPRCLGFPRPFGFCGSRPRRLWRFQLRWLRWLLPRWLRLRGLEWLQPRWPRLLKSWLRVACKAGHAISRAFPFSSPLHFKKKVPPRAHGARVVFALVFNR